MRRIAHDSKLTLAASIIPVYHSLTIRQSAIRHGSFSCSAFLRPAVGCSKVLNAIPWVLVCANLQPSCVVEATVCIDLTRGSAGIGSNYSFHRAWVARSSHPCRFVSSLHPFACVHFERDCLGPCHLLLDRWLDRSHHLRLRHPLQDRSLRHERVALLPRGHVPDRIHGIAPLFPPSTIESLPCPSPQESFEERDSNRTFPVTCPFRHVSRYLWMGWTVEIRPLPFQHALAPVRQLADGAGVGLRWEEARGRV